MLIWGGARRPVFGVAFSPDGTHLAFGTKDHLVQVWDAATGAERGCDVCLCPGGYALLFSTDGMLLVAAGDWGQVWQITPNGSLTNLGRLALPFVGYRTTGIAFTPDGQSLVAAYTARGISPALRFFGRADLKPGEAYSTGEGGSGPLAIAADGTLATGLRAITLWKLTGRREQRLTLRYPPNGAVGIDHQAEVEALALAPDSRLLASAAGKVVLLWDVATWAERGRLQGHTAAVRSLAWHPEGRMLATAGDDGTVRFWDVAGGRERSAFRWDVGKVQCVAFAPDGMRAAAGGDNGQVVIWDVEDA